MKKAQNEIIEQELRDKIEELNNNWKRALADYQNLQRRHAQEKKDFVQFANSSLILRLLATLDHLEKAAENLNDQGLNLIVAELKKVLEEEGLIEIKSQGENFNPNFMEAIEAVNGEEEGKVAEVISKGYLFKDKVLLPAKVKVFSNKLIEERRPA